MAAFQASAAASSTQRLNFAQALRKPPLQSKPRCGMEARSDPAFTWQIKRVSMDRRQTADGFPKLGLMPLALLRGNESRKAGGTKAITQ